MEGELRRYHIETVVADSPEGKVYRAFSRRKIGDVIRRRYFAIIEKGEAANPSMFNAAVRETIMTAPYAVHLEEKISNGDHAYVVIAKGVAPRKVNPKWKSMQNKGYLMLFLSAFILILMIIRFFQSPDTSQQPVVSEDHAIESVDL